MPEKPPDHPAVEKVLLLMVSGLPAAELLAACKTLGVPDDQAEEVVRAARRRLTLAARFHRDRELGTALTRLNDCYTRALKAQDIRTALGAQKELNRLAGLYQPRAATTAGEPSTKAEQAELDAIRQHLLPLKLAPATYPIREHVRIAAEKLREIAR